MRLTVVADMQRVANVSVFHPEVDLVPVMAWLRRIVARGMQATACACAVLRRRRIPLHAVGLLKTKLAHVSPMDNSSPGATLEIQRLFVAQHRRTSVPKPAASEHKRVMW